MSPAIALEPILAVLPLQMVDELPVLALGTGLTVIVAESTPLQPAEVIVSDK
jgi:hypothetical protein